MRAVVQRVSSATVRVEGTPAGSIAEGLLVLVGIGRGDSTKDVRYLANKTVGLRVFEGADGRMTRSVRDFGGSILAISQFTLYGDVRRGLRPSFDSAAAPEVARALYTDFVEQLKASGVTVETGVFGAMMKVDLVNEGPVTILIDSKKLL